MAQAITGVLLALAAAAAHADENAIAIGGTRRLFLDDRLLDTSLCRDVTQTLNPPQDIRRVLAPERLWESLGFIFYANVLEDDREVKLYYTSYGWNGTNLTRQLCLATSADGVTFERAKSGRQLVNGERMETNILQPAAIEAAIFLDPHAPSEKRYRMILSDGWDEGPDKGGMYTATSADGIRWKQNPTRLFPFIPDSQHAAFWDARLKQYVIYLRAWDVKQRKREVCRIAVDDIDQPWPYDTSVPPHYGWGKKHAPYPTRELPIVLAPDAQDPGNLDLYTSVAAPYPYAPDVYLAFPAAYFKFQGPEWKHRAQGKSGGLFEVQLATSADGIAWHRWRQPYVAAGHHDGLNLRLASMAQGMVRRGRWLHLYFVGWPYHHGQMSEWRDKPGEAEAWFNKDKGGIYLAKQRVDGFVSMDSAYAGGVLTTRPVVFAGNRLVLNLDTRGTGSASVALLDAGGTPIPGFTSGACERINADDTDYIVRWQDGADVAALAGRPVRVQIEMRNTKLYALQFLHKTEG
jgi:hypothetical protein